MMGCVPLQYALGTGAFVMFVLALLSAFFIYRRPRNVQEQVWEEEPPDGT